MIHRLRRRDTDGLINVSRAPVRKREHDLLNCWQRRRRREVKNVSLDNRPKKNELYNSIFTRKYWDLPQYDPTSCPGYGSNSLFPTLLIDRLWRCDTDGLINVLKEPVRKREQDLLGSWRREVESVSLDNKPRKNKVHNKILTHKHWDLPLRQREVVCEYYRSSR